MAIFLVFLQLNRYLLQVATGTTFRYLPTNLETKTYLASCTSQFLKILECKNSKYFFSSLKLQNKDPESHKNTDPRGSIKLELFAVNRISNYLLRILIIPRHFCDHEIFESIGTSTFDFLYAHIWSDACLKLKYGQTKAVKKMQNRTFSEIFPSL